ncbi:protein YIF1B-like [Paramacrobiotus metropolitanus]|uniref:protein YIF1B-like n=1 Tax=Paramacrobiotus metropolitanus TaxID=2943436 RepID=UPI00244564E2|nr:protein YIF1B-like [Paramacrobiotus metropolitanus]
MDAPSSGWEPIDAAPVAAKTSSHRHSTKPKKQRSSTAATSSPQFPLTANQPVPSYPGMSPAGMPYGQPQMMPGMPPDYQQYYQPPPAQPGGYGFPTGFPSQAPAYFADPLANVALAYGQTLAGQGKEIVNQNLEKWISISTLRFYFAVDTQYVIRKLFVLVMPFFVRDWSIKFPPSQCVAPREEPNAPDLYIPSMAFVTYILSTGILLGTQNRFTPEHLGMQASESLAYLVVEILLILITFYITSISSNLRFLHLLAFSGYKYVGMVACAISALFLKQFGYRIALIYAAVAIIWFFLRSLKVYILPEVTRADQAGHKRRIWALLFITVLQPMMIFLMTRQICSYEASAKVVPS